ncbi:hypothetical protein F5Y18DRAFT_444921 [Xylariaceae sp. FL1019]|nr:hypothetical protein F5Y18DRAFT_444921 [Xylariaceae sp. FL1019]
MEQSDGSDNASTLSRPRTFISRTLMRRETRSRRTDESPKGPLGLETLFEPDDNVAPVADIIFVHGLNGGSHSTWSKSGDSSKFWPKEWLPEDDAFHGTRIHTFGYPSGLNRESVLNVRDFAWSLLAALKDSPCIGRDATTRLIMVAHSMGGLVVKKAIILGNQETEFQSLIDRIRSVVFLATPHQGAAIAQTLRRLLSFIPGSRPFVEDLSPHSPLLQAINEDFPRVSSKLQLLSFFETRPMTLGVHQSLIVEKTDAVMNVANERRTLLDADHRNVAMYGSPNESAYVAVRNSLATIVASHRTSSQSQRQAILHSDQAALDKYLDMVDAPDDDLMIQDSRRLPGSCEWLSGKKSYQEWREGLGARFLWLRGRPGAGKSVLSGHIINDLKQSSKDCCFFFFSARDSTKSTVSKFLRSMAWQMAMLHPEIFDRIGNISEDWTDLPIDKIDHNPVWRRLYANILKVRLITTQYWVIDAIDECKGASETIGYLVKIQEHWPVSILVTSRDGVEAHLSNSNMEIQTDSISAEDNKHDIFLFLQSTQNLLPSVPSDDWKTTEGMVDYILQRSGGCFLWVYLVCTELREVSTLMEVQNVLNSTPSDMGIVYSRILEEMAHARFRKNVAKSALTWVTYAFRPLTTHELRDPIEMDIGDKVDSDIERSIVKSCGNLVFVDTHSKVQLIHSTAREFLTRSDLNSEFIVSKADGHGRLALVCFDFLNKQHDLAASKPRRISDSDLRHRAETNATSPFLGYASNFVFHHLKFAHSTDDRLLAALAKFLQSLSVLKWIEYIATTGDLHTVYRAGVTINRWLRRRAEHALPLDFTQNSFSLLNHWGDDLIHLVTKFSYWLRLAPQTIHHLVPPFCPPTSAIRQQFASPYRGINVSGLSAATWDDCLSTIMYARGTKPNTVEAGQGCFAVGTMSGKIMIYDDSIFQETHMLNHQEPVWRLAFAEKERMLASASARTVRIWSSESGMELMNFAIPSLCLSLTFTESDTILRATTSTNLLFEWDLISGCFLDEPVDWTVDFESEAPSSYLRTPTMIACGASVNLLAIVYRGEDILLWDYNGDRIHDFIDKDLGSRARNGPRQIGGAPTVCAIVFGSSFESDRLAVTYADGDLVLFDLREGSQLAVASRANTMLLASSGDCRTLAGVDSRGNLTLFDFDNLSILYRVQFETAGMVKSLAFTIDSLRFMELRADHCRVWEPSVLLRQDAPEEENSDTISLLTAPQEVNYHPVRDATITSIFCAIHSSLVFCGKEDGSIHAFDISQSTSNQQLPIKGSNSAIGLLYFDESSGILAANDRSSRVKAWKVTKRFDSHHKEIVWDITGPLASVPSAGTIQQVLVSSEFSRLFISSERHDTLWPISTDGTGEWIAQENSSGGALWFKHPSRPEHLVLARDREFRIHEWQNLSMVYKVIAPAGHECLPFRFGRVILLQSRKHFVTLSESPARHIEVWEVCEDKGIPSRFVEGPPRCFGNLSHKIEAVIGSFGSRLVVYMTDYWVASFALESKDVESTMVRHFFIPGDWLSAARTLLMGIGKKGEVLLVKQDQLAVVGRGLEATEHGTAFNPRRSNAQRRVPVRPALPGAGGNRSGVHTSPF